MQLFRFSYCVDDEIDEGDRCLHRRGRGKIIQSNHWSCNTSFLRLVLTKEFYASHFLFDFFSLRDAIETRLNILIHVIRLVLCFDLHCQAVAALNEKAFADGLKTTMMMVVVPYEEALALSFHRHALIMHCCNPVRSALLLKTMGLGHLSEYCLKERLAGTQEPSSGWLMVMVRSHKRNLACVQVGTS